MVQPIPRPLINMFVFHYLMEIGNVLLQFCTVKLWLLFPIFYFLTITVKSLANPSNAAEDNWIEDDYNSIGSHKYIVGYEEHKFTNQINVKLVKKINYNIKRS